MGQNPERENERSPSRTFNHSAAGSARLLGPMPMSRERPCSVARVIGMRSSGLPESVCVGSG